MEQKISVKKQDIKEGEVAEAEAQGKKFAVVMQSGNIYVLSGTCTHEGGPLGQGSLDNNELICPWHSGAYNITNGKADENTPWVTDIDSYKVRIDGNGDIFIDM